MTGSLFDLSPFLRLIWPWRKRIFLSISLGIVTTLSSLGLSGLAGGLLVACALAATSPEAAQFFHLITPIGAIRLFAIVRTAGRWAERVAGHEVTFHILGEIRTWLYIHLSRLSPRQLGDWRSGEILNRITSDIDALDNLFLRVFLPMAISLVCLLALLVGAFLLAIELAIIIGSFFLSYLIILFLSYHHGKKYSFALIQKRSRLNQEFLDSIDLLEYYDLDESSWKSQFDAVSRQDKDWIKQQKKFKLRFSTLQTILLTSCGICLGALIFEATILTPAPLSSWKNEPWMLSLFFAMPALLEILLTLLRGFTELSGTALASKRLSNLAQQEPSPAFKQNNPAPRHFDLQLKEVEFFYQEKHIILKDLSFTLPEKNHLVLMGPSGGGKTTLCKLLTRQEDPSKGQILLGGKDLSSLSEEALRNTITSSLQIPWIMRATLADNLRLACPQASERELWDVLEIVGLKNTVWPDGLETWLEEAGESLSGGQRKRIDIARCLLRKASLTILDEPTEGLSEQEALVLVQAVRKTLLGRSLIWVTHRNHGLEDFDLCLTLQD